MRGLAARGEHVDRGAHRVGIGVVGVVDHHRARRGATRDREAPGARRGTPRGRGAIDASATPAASAAAAAASALRAIVQAGHRERDRRLPCRAWRPAASTPVGRRAQPRPAPRHLRRVPKSTTRAPRARGRVAPHARVRVVGVDHRDAARRQRADRVGVLGGDLGDALHEFLVLALRVVDDARSSAARCAASSRRLAADGSCRARSRPRDAPRAAASSVSGRPIALLRLPLRGEHRAGAVTRAQDRGDHLLHRRLAVAADDDDHAAASKRARQCAASRPSAASGSATATRSPASAAPRDRPRPARPRRRARSAAATKSWPSKRSPRERDEQVARRERARVGRDAREAHVAADDAAAARRGAAVAVSIMRPLHARERGGARRAASENGVRTPSRLLVVLVALARDQHDVARARRGDRCAIALRGRARAPAPVAGVAHPLDDRVRDRRGILAARIVAGDDDAVGERAPRSRPSRGRLPGSRSPPQPNTQTSRRRRRPPAAARASTFSSASGVCA